MTAGQKHFFDQDATWYPGKKPTVGLWQEGTVNDPNIDLYKVTPKNISAVHQLYSNVSKGAEKNSKTIRKKENAIVQFLTDQSVETMAELMEFDDVISKYMGFREKEKIAKNLAIVFSGSYTPGISVVKESQIPYVLTETNGDYVATAKENMHRHFPKIVIFFLFFFPFYKILLI